MFCCFEESDSDDDEKYKWLNERKKKVKPFGLFGYKSYHNVVQEIRENSEFEDRKGWDLMSVIVKSGENIYQEKFAS